jgi:multidrug efflux pump
LLAVPAVYSIFARKTQSPQHMSRIVDRLLGNAPAARPSESAHD